MLETYRSLVSREHFLTEVPYERTKYRIATAPDPAQERTLVPPDLTPKEPIRTPPPLPEARPFAPPLRARPQWSESDWLTLLSARGANATQVSSLYLRGLRPDTLVSEPVELIAVVPSTLRATYALFSLDGNSLGMTNLRPFRCTLDPGTLPPGRHEVKVIIIDRDGREHTPPAIVFRVRATGKD